MTLKFITIDNFQIAYLEVNPEAQNTIFFIHGNSGSSRTWLKQMSDPLLNDFRMVAFDLPADGNSLASIDPDNAYSLSAMGLIADAANVSDF
jgi:pimeloyl-ACP methyl ester carboxylesterase